MKLGLFIPTYNVESRVGSVLADLARGPVDRFSKIYVIDNGSGDRSREVVAQTLRDFPTLGQRTELWQNRRNYLLGGSTLLAIEKALGDGLDYLLNLHSDGQAKVADLEGMINRCRVQGPLVLGSRLLRDSKNEEYERVRLWGNLAFSRWQRWITNSSARDLGALMA
ncbi:MAG: glycosyltransferase [Bdellovibrionales bacterium]